MDIGSVLLGLALLVLIAFVVVRPLIERPRLSDEPASPADELLAGRERVLTQLRDLDFDHTMSKINEVDYAAQRSQLVAEGVLLLKQLDRLGLAPEPGAEAPNSIVLPVAAGAAPSDEIEAAIGQVRARRAASAGQAPAARPQPARVGAMDSALAAPLALQPPLAKSAPAPADADAEIEASIAERRANKHVGLEKVFCAQCGAEAVPGDRFCARCGSPLSNPAAGLRQAKVQS